MTEKVFSAYSITQDIAANRPVTPTGPPGILIVYQSTDTNVLSVWNGAAWISGGSGGVGSPGPMGMPGLDGDEGSEGFPIPGPPGPIGSTGLTGVAGPPGPMGFAMDGEEGPEGFHIPGNQGIQGIQGVIGLQGPIGVPGMDGDEGPEGFHIPGNQGVQGNPGATGPQGPIGLGLDGADADDQPSYGGNYLPLSGGTLSGPLTITPLVNSAIRGLVLATTPLQAVVNGTTGQALIAVTAAAPKWTTAAATNKTVAAPVAPASTVAYNMQGLAGTITPTRSGNVHVTINGTITSTAVTAGDGIQYQLSWGTGTAPVNAATLTGTQVGSIQKYINPTTVTAADVAVPFSISVVVAMTVGSACWIDLAAESIAVASVCALTAVNICAIEI